MDKRIWMVIILLMTMTVTLSGCGAATPDEDTTESTEATSSEAISSEATTAAEQTEAVSETSEEVGVLASDIFNRDAKFDNYAYEYVMSSGDQILGSFKLWVDGNRVRYDAMDQGQSMYMDYDKQEGYIYMSTDNTLIKTPLGSLGNEWESPFTFANEIEDSALVDMKDKGTETLDGKLCQLFEYDNMGSKVTYYVWKEKGLIIKMMMEIEGQPSFEYYFKDLQIDGNFDKELELPKGAKIVG